MMSKLKIKIKRFDKSLPLPKYQTAGAAALDLLAREGAEILAGQTKIVPVNIAIELPPHYFALVAARSSLHKKGLTLANGIGIGDSDYRGDHDEYHVALLNFSQQSVTVEKGERLAQLIILPRPEIEWIEVDSLENPSRGGFGTTGQK